MDTGPAASPSTALATAQGVGQAAPRGYALHLLALGAFAFAQPLFDVLQSGATFFVARRSAPPDVWIFACALAFLPGLVFAGLVALAGAIAAPAQIAVSQIGVALCVALITLPPALRATGGERLWPLALAALLGAGAAVLYVRHGAVRSFLLLLSPAPLVFAALFLLGPGVRKVALPRDAVNVAGVVATDAPSALFVVLDELPLASLLAEDGGIDAERFPNFARLAARSTWMRNATASHESTEYALPMIMTGLRPTSRDLLPTAADHPRSVFSMLAGSHRMRTWETFTNVCPAEIDDRGTGARAESRPGQESRVYAMARDAAVVYGHMVLPGPLARRWLPAIDNTWGDFGRGPQVGSQPGAVEQVEANDSADQGDARAEALDREAKIAAARSNRPALVREFIASIDGSSQATLYFLHVLLPHGPFVYLPSGASYDPTGLTGDFPDGRLPPLEGIALQQLQRHLLQLGAVDRLLGQLLDRLDDVGLSERCAWVVLADHGINFEPGEFLRQVFKRNAGEIGRVPFFVKVPGQREGGVDDRPIETLDALPTLLDALGLDSPWPLDGRSALESEPQPRATRALARRFHEDLELGPAPPELGRGLQRKLRLLAGAPGWSGVWSGGAPREWIGREVAALSAGDAAGLAARLDPRRAYAAGSDQPLPIVVAGFVDVSGGRAPPRSLAVSVDGILRAAALLIEGRADRLRFTALVDEAAWSAGPGRIELWTPRDDGRLERIPLR
jgi:hypothetical protein